MKVKYIIQLLLITLLLFVNDSMYFGKQYINNEIEMRQLAYYGKIEENPAVIVVKKDYAENIREEISELYYVKEVKELSKEVLIKILSEEYGLDKSQNLLNEIDLPLVLEVSFVGRAFNKLELESFSNSFEHRIGVYSLLYSEDSYVKVWQRLSFFSDLMELETNYWIWVYAGFALLLLLIVVYFRQSYENSKLLFWKVYLRAGGSIKHKLFARISNSFMVVLIPTVITMGTQLLLFYTDIIPWYPDIIFQLIRLEILLIFSLLALFLVRREHNA